MTENISPEEKLFRIIQQEKGAALKDKDKKGEGGGRSRLKQAILSLKQRLFAMTKGIAKKPGPASVRKIHDIQLFTVNSILSIVLVLLVLFTVYYAATQYPNIAKIANATVKAQRAMPPSNKEVEQLQPLDYYTEGARERDIFNPAPAAPAASGEALQAAGEKSSSGDLKLQGIAWSDVPKAMIHSEKANKLYILKEGQGIGTTGIKVKSILHNKVILNSGDKDFEI